MKISTHMLKKYVTVPDNEKLSELTNQHITEIDSLTPLLEVDNLVVGYVKECVKHSNSDHLSVCQVDIGTKIEQIVCGAPNVKAGQYVVVAKVGAILPGNFEIKEANIRGVDSSGMICSLHELGVENKDIAEEFKEGIYYFDYQPKVGSNAVEALNFNQSSLEISITPNRSDLLSVLGFAYDLGAVLNEKVVNDEPEFEENGPENPLQVKILDDGCKRYYARYLDNIIIKPSPMWLQADLIASGIRPINNVVDVTNYVLLEYGTPLHAFDADKFGSNTIVVKPATDLYEVITLDEQTCILRSNDITITNGRVPKALGGVMGLLNSAIDQDTKKIILEAAWFEPNRVKETSSRLGLESDSSLRFEKKVDEIRVRTALNRAAELLIEVAGARVYKNISFAGQPFEKPTIIKITANETNKLLGTSFSDADIKAILKKLNIIETKPNNYLMPSYRKDLIIKEDLIEEIARLYGYNNLATKMPKTSSLGHYSRRQYLIKELRNHLSNMGLNEVITYSLINDKGLKSFTLENKESIEVLHPINDDRTVLRQSLTNGLISTVQYHLARQIDDLRLFEVGRVYSKEEETTNLSVIINGKYINSSFLKNDFESSYYVIKGILENILSKYNINATFLKETSVVGYHPGVCAKVVVGDKTIGLIGKIHPTILENTFTFEINLDLLLELILNQPLFEPVSKYPSIVRDIAVVVDESLESIKIDDLIRQTTRKYLVDLELFDLYKGEKLGDNKKSLAYRMTFNSKTQTLESEDIDKVMKSLIFRLQKELGAEIRQ